MELRAVRDPVVMAEWQRRYGAYRAEYRAKSSWLRVPFYGITAICVLGAVVLPIGYFPYLAGLEVLMLLAVGFYLSKYAYRAPACPHCGNPPFNLYARKQIRDHCYNCGYWLSDAAS
jgi:hypothetical protein